MDRGGQLGNDNAAKGKRWANAIDTALGNRCKSDGQKALVKLAEADTVLKATVKTGNRLLSIGEITRMHGKIRIRRPNKYILKSTN